MFFTQEWLHVIPGMSTWPNDSVSVNLFFIRKMPGTHLVRESKSLWILVCKIRRVLFDRRKRADEKQKSCQGFIQAFLLAGISQLPAPLSTTLQPREDMPHFEYQQHQLQCWEWCQQQTWQREWCIRQGAGWWQWSGGQFRITSIGWLQNKTCT